MSKLNPINLIVDPTKKAFVTILEFISNTFYRTDENTPIFIELYPGKEHRGTNFYDGSRIALSDYLIDEYTSYNLPRFVVFYHEVAHHLYTPELNKMIHYWAKITHGPLAYNIKYFHLINWIEDYHVETRILNEHPYLQDIFYCMNKLPVDYDELDITKAFNYYYLYGVPTPTLTPIQQQEFQTYINTLLTCRSSNKTRFGNGIISAFTVTNRKSKETLYAETIIKFYAWCQDKGIFPQDAVLPPLIVPTNTVKVVQQPITQRSVGSQGKSDDHSGIVRSFKTIYEQDLPIHSSTNIFKSEIAEENAFIQRELIAMEQIIQADIYTLDGLFTTRVKETPLIQSRVIIKNFFNPNRLQDQMLFLKKQHTYMNVAIFRDVSGSVDSIRHRLMHEVLEQLYKDIPVDITYYLYSSGKISIIEVPYIPWPDRNIVPKIYKENDLYRQLQGLTNSDAIADVITQQLSDKWLNIIVTDGDLNALMQRDNIKDLLRNVFVVAVDNPVEKELLGVSIMNTDDLSKINPVLSSINLNRDMK